MLPPSAATVRHKSYKSKLNVLGHPVKCLDAEACPVQSSIITTKFYRGAQGESQDIPCMILDRDHQNRLMSFTHSTPFSAHPARSPKVATVFLFQAPVVVVAAVAADWPAVNNEFRV